MATRGKSLDPGYKSGSHWAVCDGCGFAFRSEDLKRTWDNLWVCDEDWNSRHPQDFIQTRAERSGVTGPVRPDITTNLQPGETLGPVTTTAATFGASDATAGTAEAGRAIAGKSSDIPLPTFRAATNPSLPT